MSDRKSYTPEFCSRFFQNRQCEFFPCHEGMNTLNCLFCFCPLYIFLDCGGDYKINEKGVKDCSRCVFPHQAQNYDAVIAKLEFLYKKHHYLE